MNTREINLLAGKAYAALQVLNNITWTPYRDKLHDMASAEERQHRHCTPNSWCFPKGASVSAAAKLFAVKRIAEALTGEKKPSIADYLHCQGSAFYAHSIVANYRKECRAALKGHDLAALAALDYVEFVNNGAKP
jgi:hypothetical protein